MASNSRIILVLGMHRSGTSLCASVIGALGGDLGDNLIVADAYNLRGYFEDAAVVKLQERFHGESAPWTEMGATLPDLRGAKERNRALESRAKVLEAFLAERTRYSDRPRVIKDPRTARFLDAWQLAAGRLGIALEYVVCVRRPEEVIASLMHRDGMPRSRAALIWLQHYLDLVRDTDARFATVVDYKDWFGDPLVLARSLIQSLKLPWQGDDEALAAVLEQCIDPLLRHYHARDPKGGHVVLSEFYEMLRKGKKAANRRRLRKYATRLCATQELFEEWARAVWETEHALRACREELNRARKTGEEQCEVIAEQLATIRRHSARLEEAAAAWREQRATITGQDEELARAGEILHEQNAAIADLERALIASRRKLEEVYRSRCWRLTGPMRSLKRAFSLRA